MIDRAQLAAMNPAQRAELIFRQAQSELAQGLWRAALGHGDEESPRAFTGAQQVSSSGGLDALLAVLGEPRTSESATSGPSRVPTPSEVREGIEGRVRRSDEFGATIRFSRVPVPGGDQEAVADPVIASEDSGEAGPLNVQALGRNARFADAIVRAGERTGLPPAALASIIDAEAARDRDGTWNVHSRNPRSSAAGLGQFLSGTWEAEAERPGTWLNGEARRQGWLDDSGRVTAASRSSVLALRYSPEASIQTIADYARGNLQRLGRSGVRVGGDMESIARAAYLGHHLGPGDAAKFLKGGLDPARAQRLLCAQVGQKEALRRLADCGDATDAHRRWLVAYTERHIRPARYA